MAYMSSNAAKLRLNTIPTEPQPISNNGSLLALTLLAGFLGGFFLVFCLLLICKYCRDPVIDPDQFVFENDQKRGIEISGAVVSSGLGSSTPSISSMHLLQNQASTFEAEASDSFHVQNVPDRKQIMVTKNYLKPPQVYISNENESLQLEDFNQGGRVPRDSSFAVLEEEGFFSYLRFLGSRVWAYLRCQNCCKHVKILDPAEIRLRSQIWRLKNRQKFNYRKYPRLAWFIRIWRHLPHLNNNKKTESRPKSKGMNSQRGTPIKIKKATDLEGIYLGGDSPSLITVSMHNNQESKNLERTEFAIEIETTSTTSQKRPRLQRQKIKTCDDLTLLKLNGKSWKNGSGVSQDIQASDQLSISNGKSGYRKKTNQSIINSRKTLSGDSSKQNLTILTSRARLLTNSLNADSQDNPRKNLENNRSTRTTTPSDMLVTESFNSLEHVPGFLDWRRQLKTRQQSSLRLENENSVQSLDDSVNRRTQFVHAKRRSALMLLERDNDDYSEMPRADSDLGQPKEFNEKALQNLSKGSPSTGVSARLIIPPKDSNCIIHYKRIRARRNSSSSQQDYSYDNEFGLSLLQHPEGGLISTRSLINCNTYEENQAYRLRDIGNNPLICPPIADQEPIEKQVQKWLEGSASQFLTNYKDETVKPNQRYLNSPGSHTMLNKDSLESELSIDEMRKSNRNLQKINSSKLPEFQDVSGISSDSPQFLVPSLTLDSSDGFFPTIEMDEYIADTLGYDSPTGYILRRHSDNPCSSKRSNVSSLVGANMDVGVYSLDRADTCDGYECGLISPESDKMKSRGPIGLTVTQNIQLAPGSNRERSASSQWPSTIQATINQCSNSSPNRLTTSSHSQNQRSFIPLKEKIIVNSEKMSPNNGQQSPAKLMNSHSSLDRGHTFSGGLLADIPRHGSMIFNKQKMPYLTRSATGSITASTVQRNLSNHLSIKHNSMETSNKNHIDPLSSYAAMLENRRFSSHLKPLDAQWIRRHHSHSVEAIVPSLARQKRIGSNDRVPYMNENVQPLLQKSPLSATVSSRFYNNSSSPAMHNRFSRSFCEATSIDSSQSSRNSVSRPNFVGPIKVPGSFYRNSNQAQRHNSFGAQSASNTPRNRQPHFLSYASSFGSTATGHSLPPVDRLHMMPGSNNLRHPKSWASMQRMMRNVYSGNERSSVPNSPHVVPYPSQYLSFGEPKIDNQMNRKVHSFEFDWSATPSFNIPLRQQMLMQKFYSTGGSVRNSFGASLSSDKGSANTTGSPGISKRLLHSMRTSSSSTNSIIPNGLSPANMLNPPDLIFSPASRRVSAVDQAQNEINNLSCGLSMRNLFRQSNVYDDEEVNTNEPDPEVHRFDPDELKRSIINPYQNSLASASSKKSQRRSSSQNLDDAPQAPVESYYHRPLSKYQSTGNFSFEYGGRNRSGNQSPRYEYSPLEQSNDNLLFQKQIQEQHDLSLFLDDYELIDPNGGSDAPPSPAPDMGKSLLPSMLYTDVADGLDPSWNQRRLGATGRGIIVQPSLGPVIDASDESTSDGRSGSLNTEKFKLAASDQSSLNVTHQSSSSSQEFRRKSFVNLRKRISQRLQKTTDTSFDDNSFEFDGELQQHLDVDPGNRIRLQRPSSFIVNGCKGNRPSLSHAASMEYADNLPLNAKVYGTANARLASRSPTQPPDEERPQGTSVKSNQKLSKSSITQSAVTLLKVARKHLSHLTSEDLGQELSGTSQ